jgi:Flp pilus assembly protein TadG
MLCGTRSLLARLGQDTSGAVAPIFGVTAMVLFLAGGLAIDMGNAVHARNRIAAAIDAAALAAAKGMREQNLSIAEGQRLAQDYLDANIGDLGNLFAKINATNIQINPRSGSVQIDIDATVTSFFGRLAGIPSYPIPTTSVALVEGKDIEVGLQLDVTGSMASRQGNTTRIAALKTATKDMLDILIPNTPGAQKVRVGLAPYSAGVNAGSYASAVNGGRSGTCVYERQSLGLQSSDAAPVGAGRLKIRADLTGSGINSCSTATVVPMTDNKTLLKSQVDAMTTNGTTAGHLGTAWASYLISPEWKSVWPTASEPAPYNDGKTMKFAILMTDGDYNTVGGINYGDNDPQSDNYAISTCAEMKSTAKKITVYSVGFGDSLQPQALNTLQTCASDSSKFFLARDEDELRAAFRAIAQDITSLRLTK